MRIAVFHDPPPGGARRAVVELTRRLARRHSVDVYLIGRAGEALASAGEYGAAIHVTAFRPRPHRRMAAYWNDLLTWRDLEEVRRLERGLAARIDAGGYDVAFVSVLRNGQAPSVLRYLRTPAAYYCHEPPRRFYEPWCKPQAGPMSFWERGRRLWRLPGQAALDGLVRRRDAEHARLAGLVLTNSRYTRARVRQVYGRDAEVCYLGVDAQRWHPAPAAAPPAEVLSVGALEPHKGFDFLIRAIGRVRAERRPALTVVGSGGHPAMPAHLRTLAEREGVRLRLRGALSDEALAAAFRASAAFVFGARYEPFGLVVLEAMASGLPVVAVAEGGVPEIVSNGRTGHLVPRDEQAFAFAVEGLLADHDRRLSMARAARAEATAAWSWDAAVGRLEESLERAAGAPQWGNAPQWGKRRE